jgi:hypothetical protein
VSPEFGQAARSLLAGEDDSPPQLAARAVEACDRISLHLARLLGDAGIQLLMKRSIGLASARFPWLSTSATADDAVTAMRRAMEQQDSESVTEAFVAVLSAFVGLLERLIGEGLVERLLDEVWPTVFTYPAKDTL